MSIQIDNDFNLKDCTGIISFDYVCLKFFDLSEEEIVDDD